MVEKQKPQPKIVTVAAKAMKHPETVTNQEIKQMAQTCEEEIRYFIDKIATDGITIIPFPWH